MNETVVEIYNLKTNTRNYSFKVLNETKVVMYRGMLRSHKTHVTPPVSSKEPLAFSCFFLHLYVSELSVMPVFPDILLILIWRLSSWLDTS